MIVIAILFSVALLFRFAAPPRKIGFSHGERLPENAFLFRLRALAKRCKSTRRGFGIYYRHIKFKKVFDAIRKKMSDGYELEEWESELCGCEQAVLRFYEKSKNAVRHCYTLGHIDGLPRIYVFCERVVCFTDGDISSSKFQRAVHEYEKIAPFTDEEKRLLCDMLRFCLCAYLYGTVCRARRFSDVYLKGYEDGKNGKADLDGIAFGEYVCGLLASVSETERRGVERLLEENKVSIDSALSARKKNIAKTCAVVRTVMRSLEATEGPSYSFTLRNAGVSKGKKMSVPLKNALFAIQLALTLIAATLTCIFVPQKFAAVFFVVSVVLYALCRLPLIMFAYDDIFFDPYALAKRVFRKKRIISHNTAKTERINNFEAAYFGDETEYYVNDLITPAVTLKTDNRGEATLGCLPCERTEKYKIAVLFYSDAERYGLAQFDAIFEKHRTVYKKITPAAEFSVEFAAAVDSPIICCKLTSVNRGESASDLKAAILLTPYITNESNVKTAKAESGVALLANSNRCALLSCGDGGNYGGNINAFCKDGVLNFVESTLPAAICVVPMRSHPYKKSEQLVTIAFGSCLRQAERLTDFARGDGYFEYVTDCARVFFSDKEHIAHSKNASEEYAVIQNEYVHPTPSIPDFVYVRKIENFGFTESGEFAVDTVENLSDKVWKNVLSSKKTQLVMIGKSISHMSVLGVTASAEDNFCTDETGGAFVALEENGVVWSPLSCVNGRGDFKAIYGVWFGEFYNAYNGCITDLKCFPLLDGDGILFDLTISNKTDIKRTINVMLSFLPKNAERFELSEHALGFDCDGTRLSISSSNKINEYARFKEGYYIRGKVAVASGFRVGGTTPAPTVSVSAEIDPEENSRIVFALGAPKDLSTNLTDFADRETVKLKEFYDCLCALSIDTGDRSFDIMYKLALYQAYLNGITRFSENESVEDCCEFCAAIKYVDPDYIRSTLIGLASSQSSDGSFIGGGEAYFCYAVVDYVEHTQDFGLLDELVSFRIDRRKEEIEARMSDHCLRALSVIVRDNRRAYDNASDIVASAYRDKKTIYALHYFIPLYQGAARNEMIGALNDIAGRFEADMSLLKRVNYNKVDSQCIFDLAELLYRMEEKDRAYSLLKFNTPIERFAKGNAGNCIAPYYFGMRTKPNVKNDRLAARFFTVVTEQLLGIEFRGEKVRVKPRLPNEFRRARIDVRSKYGKARLLLDNSEKEGEWRMKTDKISMALTDIKLDPAVDKTVTLYKDGE